MHIDSSENADERKVACRQSSVALGCSTLFVQDRWKEPMALSRSEWRSVPMSEDETPIGDARASLALFFTFWLSGIRLFLCSV